MTDERERQPDLERGDDPRRDGGETHLDFPRRRRPEPGIHVEQRRLATAGGGGTIVRNSPRANVDAQVGDGVHDTLAGDELARNRAERQDALHVSAGRPA